MAGDDTLRELHDLIEEFGVGATGISAQLADLSYKFGAAPKVQHRVVVRRDAPQDAE
jgi:hypothetical protein